MKTPLAALLVLGLSALATPASAQFVRYEGLMDWVEGTSRPEASARRAEREARASWEAAARSRERHNYRWGNAQEIARHTYTSNRNGAWVGHARAYPCRVYVEVGLRGTLTSSDTPPSESQRVCAGFPSFQEAQRHSCRTFFPLRR